MSLPKWTSSVQFSSVSQSSLTLCNPMDCRAPSKSHYSSSQDDVKIHQGCTFTEVNTPSANINIEAKES